MRLSLSFTVAPVRGRLRVLGGGGDASECRDEELRLPKMDRLRLDFEQCYKDGEASACCLS